ncbi:hypothetical protein BKA62DRAFT_720119, partial [Auriculariales sp. MPI-PUGE-AT-0066]
MMASPRPRGTIPVHIRNVLVEADWEEHLSLVHPTLHTFVWIDVQVNRVDISYLRHHLSETCANLRDINIIGPIGMAPGAIAMMKAPKADASIATLGSLASAHLQNLPAWFAVDVIRSSPGLKDLAFGAMPYFAGDCSSTAEAVRLARLRQLKLWDNGAYNHPLFAHIVEANISSIRVLEMSLGHILLHQALALPAIQLANRLTTLRIQSRATIERIDAEFAAGDWRALNLTCWCQLPLNRTIYANAAARTAAILACCPRLRDLHLTDFLAASMPPLLEEVAKTTTLKYFGAYLHHCGLANEHKLQILLGMPALRGVRRIKFAGDGGMKSEDVEMFKAQGRKRRIEVIAMRMRY